jgi:succinate-semialdehyde dehydrogenase/glutarate-semialdehyde dehydrogenase
MIEAVNPATLRPLGSVTPTQPQDVEAILADVATVQALWAQLRLSDRARYLRRTAQAVIDEFDDLSEVLARESGRPRADVATRELLAAIDALRWLASSGERLLGSRRIPLQRVLHPAKRATLGFEPAGVVAVIGAGSAPLALPLSQIGAALLGGNGVVYKPSPRASQAAERLARLFTRAGLPEGLVRIVHGDGELGRAVTASPLVARVLFTGQERAAKDVAETCARAGRGAVIETPGADPMLVLADANAAHAAAGAVWAAAAGAGQLHGTVKRVFVEQEIHNRFLAELVGAAGALRLGDPLDPATDLGPLAGEERRARLVAAIEEACAQGARLRCGAPAAPDGLPGAFHSLAVLSEVQPAMALAQRRVAGPLIAVVAVRDADEAVALANTGDHGLGASVWSADRFRAARVARELRAGSVWLNDHLPSPGVGRAPWGSLGAPSVWRTQGAAGLRNCVEPKLITWDPPSLRSPWWHPYDQVTLRAAQAVAAFASVRDSDRERALRGGTLALARVAGRALRDARRR